MITFDNVLLVVVIILTASTMIMAYFGVNLSSEGIAATESIDESCYVSKSNRLIVVSYMMEGGCNQEIEKMIDYGYNNIVSVYGGSGQGTEILMFKEINNVG